MFNYLESYFDNGWQINLIALQTALIGCAISASYVYYYHDSALIVMLNGLLMNSLMLAFDVNNQNHSQRIYYGILCALVSGVCFGIGAVCADNVLFASIGIVIILPWVIFANSAHLLLVNLCVYIFEGFIIGTGVGTVSFSIAVNYAVFYMLGGLLIAFCGVIRLAIWHKLGFIEKHNRVANIPYIALTKTKIIYNILMLIIVLICNYIAMHFNLQNGYWLPLTAFLIIRGSHSISFSRAVFRVIGTVIGGAVAFLLCYNITNMAIIVLLIAPVFYLTIISISRHYGSFTTFITISIALEVALVNDKISVFKIMDRIIYTIITVIVVIIALHLIKLIANKAIIEAEL